MKIEILPEIKWKNIEYQNKRKLYEIIHLQGVPPQRGKCILLILAPVNVITTTFLMISCTKHLHNSFCIHFDAFWCILMHSEHFEKIGQFQPKKN